MSLFRAKNLKKRYQLTLEDFQTMEASQQKRCQICKSATNPLSVDHNHENGKIRGLLCTSCNLGLGHFHDSPRLLRCAAKYLKKSGA